MVSSEQSVSFLCHPAMASILKDLRAAFGDVEPAPYTVVVQRGGYEERVYPSRQWACTSMSGPSRHELVTPMFRRLFSYISGRNEPNIRIDMTTPVVTYVEPQDDEGRRRRRRSKGEEGGDCCDGDITENPFLRTPSTSSTSTSSCLTYTMAFMVPASHQEAPPTTADKRIFFERRKKMAVLVRRFGGYLNDEVVRRELAALREAITNNGDAENVDFQRYFVVGYDPPFKLLGRRNEIWVVKRVWEPEEEEVLQMEKGCCGEDFVLVEREMQDEELVVVNGVVEGQDNALDENKENAVGRSGGTMENVEKENAVVVEVNGVVGKANGDVVFVETLADE